VKRNVLFSLLSMAVIAMFLLSACGGDAATATAPPAATTAPAAATSAPAAGDASGLPKLAKKDKYKIGFSQIVSNNPWRLAETQSMKDEAAKRGWDIVVTDATDSSAKQVSDVDSLIAQKVDAIFLAPREEKPLAAAVLKAKAAGIPVILLDRTVDATQAVGGKDYITFIGSDFVQEGKRVADWLIKKTNGTAKIIELEGSVGASPANDRKKGFDDVVKKQPGMKIVASQSGDFARDKGRQVMQTLLQAHPDVTAVYAHNDEMAIGAIAALEAAGKKPGQDVIVVSIDGTRDALNAIASGKMGATVQSSPFFGPVTCATLKRYVKGEKIEPWVKVSDKFYDKSNAKASMADGY
jgi:ABC-type sugar transport system substrate-binding protein